MKREFIVTIRTCARNGDQIEAGRVGVDLVLETTDTGYLMFPRDLFLEAQSLLDQAEADAPEDVEYVQEIA